MAGSGAATGAGSASGSGVGPGSGPVSGRGSGPDVGSARDARIGVAEAWVPQASRLAAYVRPDELHQAFNFPYLLAGWDAARLREVIDETLAACGTVGAPATWVLSNHDVVRPVTRFGGGHDGLARARAALLLELALPGSAHVYQGEELGLPEVEDLPAKLREDPVFLRSGGARPGRDGCRVPIPWAGAAPPFAFSTHESTWLPQPAAWTDLTVEAQLRESTSTLALYREALRIRREHPALGPAPQTHHLNWHEDGAPPGVLAFERDPGFVCAVNVTSRPVRLMAYGALILSSGPVDLVNGDRVALPPDTAAWWSSGG
ncbi:DUF3459 domain-containing protein [Streptomyces sp. SID3343]|nr:DUF3459 domain-containing protein [Streptomyces sp. SID3343]